MRESRTYVAYLRGGATLLLTLRHDDCDFDCYLTFRGWAIPHSLRDMSRHLAMQSLRLRPDYDYPRTTLGASQVDALALEICSNVRLIGPEKVTGGLRIKPGTWLKAHVGHDPRFGIPYQFHRIWRANAPIIDLYYS